MSARTSPVLDDPRLLRALYPWECSQGSAPDAQQVQAYLRESGLTDPARLALRAAAAGLGAENFVERLSASSVALAPPWWSWLQRVDLAWSTQGEQLLGDIVHDLPPEHWLLLGHIHAELGLFAQDLLVALEHQLADSALALQLQQLLVPIFVKQAWALAQPTILLELRLAAQNGELKCSDPRQRFLEFTGQLSGARRPRYQLLYPMLWRDLATRALQLQDWFPELLGEIHSHRQALSEHFGFAVDLAELIGLDASVADPHQHGRCTLILYFAGGKLVYKPRDLRIEEAGLQLYARLCQKLGWAPPLPRTWHGRHGGLVGFVERQDLPDEPGAAARYYYFCGVLLAFGQALLANDLHHENIIATAGGPLPIDLETLFQPLHEGTELGVPSDLLQLSLLRVGLLPRSSRSDPAEASALLPFAGQRYQASDFVDSGLDSMRLQLLERTRGGVDRHLPYQRAAAVLVQGFEHALEQGLLDGLRALRGMGADPHVQELLERIRGARVRQIARATQQYQMLLDAALTPRYQQSAARRLALFDKLWLGHVPQRTDAARFQAEVVALVRRDVPYFAGPADAVQLHGSDCAPISWVQRSAWESVRERWSTLDDPTQWRRHQQTLRFAFATQIETGSGHRVRSLPCTGAPPKVDQSQWRLLARELAGHIKGLAYADAQHLNWLQLEGTEHGLRVQHAGLGLYNGIAGIMLALARLARSELGTAEDMLWVERLQRSIEFRLRLNPRALSSVGYAGAGGILYAAGLLAQLGFAALSAESVARIHAYLDSQREAQLEQDVISGSAGALLGLCAHAHSGDRGSLTRIAGWVARIQQQAQPVAGGLAWSSSHYPLALTGVAHGAAGIALALHEAKLLLDCRSRQEAVAPLYGSRAYGHVRTHKDLFEVSFGNTQAMNTTLINAALHFEESYLDPGTQVWRDARFGVVPHSAEVCMAWCHGAPGLWHARLRLWAPAQRAALRAPLTHILEQGFGDDWVICHGDFGQLMMLKSAHAAGVLDTQAFEQRAAQVYQGWSAAWPALSDQALGMGLFDGLAGVLWAALDLGAPESSLQLDLLGLASHWEHRACGN